jgi:hypothetical protein
MSAFLASVDDCCPSSPNRAILSVMVDEKDHSSSSSSTGRPCIVIPSRVQEFSLRSVDNMLNSVDSSHPKGSSQFSTRPSLMGGLRHPALLSVVCAACIVHRSQAISTLSASAFTPTAPSRSNLLRLRGGAPASTSPTMFSWGSKNAEPKFLPLPVAPAEELIASRVGGKHLDIHQSDPLEILYFSISLSFSASLSQTTFLQSIVASVVFSPICPFHHLRCLP